MFRFALAVLVAAQCMTLAAAGKIPRNAVVAPNVSDRLTETEIDFTTACREGNQGVASSLARVVDQKVAEAEYLNAYFSDRPNIVRAILAGGKVNMDASWMTFPSRAADQLRLRLRREQIDRYFPVSGTTTRARGVGENFKFLESVPGVDNVQGRYGGFEDREKSPEETATEFERAEKRLPQYSNKAGSPPDIRKWNVMLNFSHSGALMAACNLKQAAMVSALLSGPYANENSVAACYWEGTRSLDHVFNRDKEDPVDRKNFVEAILSVGQGDVATLLKLAIGRYAMPDFGAILRDRRVTTAARAEALKFALKTEPGYDVKYKMAFAQLLLDRTLLADRDVRLASALAVMDSRKEMILDVFYPVYLPWSKVAQDERRIVLDALVKTYDSKWIETVIVYMKIDDSEAAIALRYEMGGDVSASEHESLRIVLDRMSHGFPPVKDGAVERTSLSASASRVKGKFRSYLPSGRE